MNHYANVADLTEIDRTGRMIVAGWIDRDDIRDLETGRVDGHYVRIGGDDDEQERVRAEILADEFGVRVKTGA